MWDRKTSSKEHSSKLHWKKKINKLTFYLKELEKEDQTKPKVTEEGNNKNGDKQIREKKNRERMKSKFISLKRSIKFIRK